MDNPLPPLSSRLVIDALVRADGTVSLGQAYSVANALGIPDQRMRLTVGRLLAEGRFTKSGRGRAGVLTRTTSADIEERHDVEFVALAYAQDRGEAPWDGYWRLISVSVPESNRALRDHARRTLLRLGAALLPGGIYLSPHDLTALLLAEAPDLADQKTLLVARAHELTLGDIGDPRQIAAAAWPLSPVAAAHHELNQLIEHPPAFAGSDAPVARAMTWAHAFDLAHRQDPLLPPELLPQPWIGTTTRASFARAWNSLQLDPTLFHRFRIAATPRTTTETPRRGT